MTEYDFVILTDDVFIKTPTNRLQENGWEEDQLIVKALQKQGFRVTRKSWSDPEFDWSSCRFAIFRTTWDYFDRFDEWKAWLKRVEGQTTLINPISMVWWNMDKHYLGELEKNGIRIPETRFIDQHEPTTLKALLDETGWDDCILKPCVAGSARHTYRFNRSNSAELEPVFSQLIANEDMMLQPFQKNIQTQGEVSIMIIGGQFTHAVIKRAQAGDFRVQDNFGGTVALHQPSQEEIEFAEKTATAISPLPAYARVDLIRNNDNELALIEVELIEPELWFRLRPSAAEQLARHLALVAH